jgi:opacity protein-like surface antigen
MKKYMKLIVISLGVAGYAVLSAPASAQGAYVGIDFVNLNNKVTGTTSGVEQAKTFHSINVRLKAGYDFTDMFGVELQALSFGLSDTQRDASGTSYKMTTGPVAGVYGRIEFPLGNSAGIYGLLGIATVTTEYSQTPQFSVSGPRNRDTHSGLSFGLGMEVRINDHLIGTLDWMYYRIGTASYPAYYTDKPDQVIGGLGAGVTFLF